ncbi:MAG: tyrosine-type recombinase/integrase [Candidatus Aenigmarchaeota archaeon]|nr:tyrosine-type recombinase/integrase [Candidatus Aenigmarchaeota archaeon]
MGGVQRVNRPKNELLAKMLTEMKLRGFTGETYKTYLFNTQKFILWYKKDPKTAELDDIKEYLAELIDEGKSFKSIALIKSAILFLYNEVLGKAYKIKTPKTTKSIPVVLTKTEIKKILDFESNHRNKTIICFFYSTGIRLSELINMKWDDLDMNDKIAWVREGKGKKHRMIILSEILISYLRTSLRDNRTPKGYVFNGKTKDTIAPRTVEYIVHNAALRAGIRKRVHVHTMRHSFATHLLENGTDIRKIQELLGHANLATTQIYTSVSKSQLKAISSPMDAL